jgi:hypothetical protein
MTKTGWAIMIVSWAVILGTFAFALMRTLSQPEDDAPGGGPENTSSTRNP